MLNFVKIFISICFLTSFVFSDRKCVIPPEFWCDTPETSKLCDAEASCALYNRTMAEQKIHVTLLYEALCPDCQQFITELLYPLVYQQLKELIVLNLVPFGNARELGHANGTFNFECQHGPKECYLNKLHACSMEVLPQVDSWFPLIRCYEEEARKGSDPDHARKTCFNSQKIDDEAQSKIINCQKGPKGGQLMHEAATYTKSVWPTKHNFVPWIVLNGISTTHIQADQANLPFVICFAYRGENIPERCRMAMKAKLRTNKRSMADW